MLLLRPFVSVSSEALKSGIDVNAMDAGYSALLSLFTASRRGADRPISAMAHPLARAAQRCLARATNAGLEHEVRSATQGGRGSSRR